MKDKYIHIIHQYLNEEIEISEVKAMLPEKEFQEWKDTLNLIQEIPETKFDSESEYELLVQKRSKQSKRISANIFIKVAAVLVLLLATTLFTTTYILSDNKITYISSLEAKGDFITLPDQSQIKLNHSSSITLNKNNWAEDRTLKLEGEAYFDVEEGSTFTVQTDLGNVKVLGTTFNVKFKDQQFSVTCYTGKVKVNFLNTEVILEPGQSINNLKKEVYIVNDERPAWIEKSSSFENTPLAEVIANIEQDKGVKIKLNINKNLYFTGGYSNEMSTSEILDLICRSLDLRFKKLNDSSYEIYSTE